MCRSRGTGAGRSWRGQKLNGMRNCCKLCLSLVCYSVRGRVRFGLHGSASSDREITCTSRNHKTAYRDPSLREIHIERGGAALFRLDSDIPRILFHAKSGVYLSKGSSKSREIIFNAPSRKYISNSWRSRVSSFIQGYKAGINRTPSPLISFSSLPGFVYLPLEGRPLPSTSKWINKSCRTHYLGKGGSQRFSAPQENARARARGPKHAREASEVSHYARA